MILGGGTSERGLVHESGTLMVGISALIKKKNRPQRVLLPFLPCEDTDRSWVPMNKEAGLHQILNLPES